MLTFKEVTQSFMIEAFYLADRQDEHKVDDIIAGWTGIFPCNWQTPPVSHAERGAYVDNKLWFFSSTSRKELGTTDKKKNGTRWIPAEVLLKHPERWTLLRSDKMTPDDISIEISRANGLLDKFYDMTGVILDFIRPVVLWNQRKKIYCSKATHFMDTGKYERISPRRRFKRLVKQGYNPLSVMEALMIQKHMT